jgi:hypothetical protein
MNCLEMKPQSISHHERHWAVLKRQSMHVAVGCSEKPFQSAALGFHRSPKTFMTLLTLQSILWVSSSSTGVLQHKLSAELSKRPLQDVSPPESARVAQNTPLYDLADRFAFSSLCNSVSEAWVSVLSGVVCSTRTVRSSRRGFHKVLLRKLLEKGKPKLASLRKANNLLLHRGAWQKKADRLVCASSKKIG